MTSNRRPHWHVPGTSAQQDVENWGLILECIKTISASVSHPMLFSHKLPVKALGGFLLPTHLGFMGLQKRSS